MSSKEYLYQGEEEREPTPQQLNAEMNAVYDHLPRVVVEIEEDWNPRSGLSLIEWLETPDAQIWAEKWEEEDNRREDSEHKQRLMKRVKNLTSKAPITPSFRKFITDVYSASYNIGISPEEEQGKLERTYFFLDRGKPESGGIFDPKRAEQFEYQALAREKDFQLSIAGALLRGFAQATGKEISEEHGEKAYLRALEPIEKWKRQIIQRYGKFDPQ